MTSPLGAADFFALEAGECLDRLATMADKPDPPPADDFLRTSRVLRGSALMAGQAQIARAAGGLEALARVYRDHRLSWDAATREHVAQSVEEFRLLVRRVKEWNEADTARAARLGRDLENLAGHDAPDSGERVPAAPAELQTGVRAFVAREGALIASALDRAARSLRATPGDREPLYNVIRRMQSLRGLAELGDLVPLPEILDGIELAVGDLTRLFAPPPEVDQVMEGAARALTRISRDVAERGKPDPDAEEARSFTELLLRAFAVEHDVVPIESLYYAGDRDPFTKPVSQPQFTAPEPLGPLELVSHGEHLCQTADLIESATTATQRDLRLYHLLGALRSAAAPSSDPVTSGLGVFARSAQEALAAGVASRSLSALVARFREAGELLRGMEESDDRMLISRRLLDVAHRLDSLRTTAVDTAAVGTAAVEPEPVPIESLAYDGESARQPEQPVVPIESLAPDAPGGGLEGSFRTFELLLKQRGPRTPSIDALTAAGSSAAGSSAAVPTAALSTAAVPTAAVPTASVPTAAVPTATPPEPEPVAIGTLCYRGQAALERANAVRQEIAAQLKDDADMKSLQPLLQELLDLVPLALERS